MSATCGNYMKTLKTLGNQIKACPLYSKKDGPKAWVCVVSLYSLLLTGRTDTPCTTSADVVHEAVATRPD